MQEETSLSHTCEVYPFCSVQLQINSFSAIKAITSPSHNIEICLINNREAVVEFGNKCETPSADIVLDYEVEFLPRHHVEVEEYAPGLFAAMYSFAPDVAHIDVKSEVIFILDCSRSMAEQNKMDYVKKAMELFLQNIPRGCLLNIYRSGSRSVYPTNQLTKICENIVLAFFL